MIRFLALGVLFFASLIAHPSSVFATPIIADLSQYRIEMDASFNGTRLFLFGVRNDAGDVVVVVRGPQKDFILRKKEPIAGIWINRDRMKFYGIPDFYAVAASRPLEEIMQTTLFQRLAIGVRTLMAPPVNPAARARFDEYSQALIGHQQKRRLFMEKPARLEFMGETLFKTTVDFPDTIPPGEYTAEIYLIDNGEVAGMQSTPITVSKSGLDAFLYDYAHHYPTLYGITAIVLALAAGWAASRIFENV